MTKLKRLVAVTLAVLMVLGSFSMAAFAWDPENYDGSNLTISTKIFREVNGEWVETEKVKQGETVKARVYLGTDYYTNSGDLLFFYDGDFFSDAYGSAAQTLILNPYYSASPYAITGTFYGPDSASAVALERRMLNAGRITSAFAAEYDAISVGYLFGSTSRNLKLNIDKWFCEFTLTVNADASGSGMLLAVEETSSTSDFTAGYINVPKGPYDGYNEDVVDMSNWNVTLSYTEDPVDLFINPVLVTFKANEGLYADDAKENVYEGEAGEAIAPEIPEREGFTFAGWRVEGTEDTAAEITVYPAADTVYEAIWVSDSGLDETLTFRTEIHRLNPETNEWEKTDKVKRGEMVKARLFIDTTYYTNSGDILVFYDNDFFTDAYAPDTPLALAANDSETSSAAMQGVNGTFTKASNTNNYVLNTLVNYGYLTTDFIKDHTAFAAQYRFNPAEGAKLSGDEWFLEFDLQVLGTATGEGDFFMVVETIQNTDEGYEAYVNVPLSSDKGDDINTVPMYLWDVNTDVTSNPVTIDSTITLNADGGVFAENASDVYVIEGYVGDTTAAPANPTKEGYTFMGWVDEEGNAAEIPATMPYEDITLTAVWQENVTITFVLNNGEADLVKEVTSGADFEAPAEPAKTGAYFRGWTDDLAADNPTGLPAVYPSVDTTYYAVFENYEYTVYYYVFNADEGKFGLVEIATVEYEAEIPATPAIYTAPEGYTLSEAYKDVSFSIKLAEGETMPTTAVNLYYKLTANTYDAIFDANGGAWADGSVTQTVPTAYDSAIVAPKEEPTMEGYNFVGWQPVLGIMDEEGKTYVAAWEKATYTATYIVDGGVYEAFDVIYGDPVDVPADPYKEGYEFIGWEPAVDETMPAHDTEYIAVFEVQTYDAVFDPGEGGWPTVDENGDTVIDSEPVTVPTVYGEAIEIPEDPEREGYDFGGWEPVPGTMPGEDTTYEAIWNPATATKYTIETYTMDTTGNYGDPYVQEKSGTTGDSVEVTPNASEGMYVDEAQSVLKGTIAADGSTVLKVYYARDEIKVVFDATTGGKFEDDSEKIEETYYYGAAVAAPADPEKTGFTFNGWAPVIVPTAVADATYVAQWTANEYTITFDTAGGTEIDPITGNYGDEITVPENPTKEGHTFDKWVDGEGKPAEVPTEMPAKDTDLIATWIVNNYDISLDANGGVLSNNAATFTVADVPYGSALAGYNVPAGTPTQKGYTFLGWAEAADSKEVVATELPATMPAGDINYYAVWEINEYTISFDTAGGSVIDPITDDYGATIDVPENPTKEGHEFTGWVDAEGNEATVPTTMPDGDVALTATWKTLSYNVTFIVDGEIVSGPTATEYGSTIAVPANPSKGGFIFTGWAPSVPATMPAEDLEFVAQWVAETGVGYYLEVYEMDIYGNYPEKATMVMNPVNGVVGESVTVSYTAPTGFTIDQSKTVLSGTIPSTGTLVLKAYISRNAHKLIVDVDGDKTETTYYYGAPIAAVETPEKDGYAFAGWSPEIPAQMPDNDVEVVATWKANTIDAVFDAGEGIFPDDETTATVPVEFGQEITAPADKPERDGYDFLGWATEADPETPIEGSLGTMDKDGEKYVAVWQKASYTLTFYDYIPADGATSITPTVKDEILSIDYEYEKEIVFPSTTELYEYEYYTFVGWTETPDAPIDAANIISEDEILTMPAGDYALYAVYTRVKVMLIPKNDTCTTVIDRAGLTVDDYEEGVSEWYVYGLRRRLTEARLLAEYIDVQGDGRIEIIRVTNESGTYRAVGTGAIVNVYDNVTGDLVESFRIVIFGDVNGDGDANAADASIIYDESIGMTDWSRKTSDDYKAYMFKAANIRQDSRITTNDGALVEDYAIGMCDIDQVTGTTVS